MTLTSMCKKCGMNRAVSNACPQWNCPYKDHNKRHPHYPGETSKETERDLSDLWEDSLGPCT